MLPRVYCKILLQQSRIVPQPFFSDLFLISSFSTSSTSLKSLFSISSVLLETFLAPIISKTFSSKTFLLRRLLSSSRLLFCSFFSTKRRSQNWSHSSKRGFSNSFSVPRLALNGRKSLELSKFFSCSTIFLGSLFFQPTDVSLPCGS